jgi:peptidoglycan/LPS O-acetylase OafA/YrhL
MRGAAAIVVLIYHAHWTAPIGYWQESYLAVDLFFALSGFVLTHAYGPSFVRGMDTRDFMRVRIIRLYPLYLVGTLLGLALYGSHAWAIRSSFSFLVLLANSLLGLPASMPWHTDANLYPLDPPAWSLFFEMSINLALVLAWRRLTSGLLPLLLALGALAVVCASWHYGSLEGGFTWEGFPVGAARVCYSFFAGAAIQRWQLRLLRIPAWTVIALMLAMFAVPTAPSWRFVYDAAAVLIGVPCLVMLGAATEPGKNTLGLARFAGLTSYAIYVIHQPLTLLLVPAAHAFPRVPGVLLVAGFTVLVVIAAALLDRFYDGPIRRHLIRLTAKRRKPLLQQT